MENDDYEYVDINEHLNKMFKQKVIQPTKNSENIVVLTDTQIKTSDHIIIDRHLLT